MTELATWLMYSVTCRIYSFFVRKVQTEDTNSSVKHILINACMRAKENAEVEMSVLVKFQS